MIYFAIRFSDISFLFFLQIGVPAISLLDLIPKVLKQPPINTWGLNCPSDFFTVEILPVFFLFWFLWIRRHDWVSGYMMGRGTSRQIIPQLCSYNTNTLITYHAYVTYMCKQEHIYHTMWHAMSRQWLLHTFWCVRPTILLWGISFWCYIWRWYVNVSIFALSTFYLIIIYLLGSYGSTEATMFSIFFSLLIK